MTDRQAFSSRRLVEKNRSTWPKLGRHKRMACVKFYNYLKNPNHLIMLPSAQFNRYVFSVINLEVLCKKKLDYLAEGKWAVDRSAVCFNTVAWWLL